MSLQDVLNALVFRDPNHHWTTHPDVPVDDLVVSEQTQVRNLIIDLYNGAPNYGKTMLEAVAAVGPIRIGKSPSDQPGLSYGDYTLTSVTPYIGINLAAIDKLYYINDHGLLVKEKPILSIAHEFAHYYLGQFGRDPISIESDMNDPSYKYRGPTVDRQNQVATELGFTGNIQASYSAFANFGDDRFNRMQISQSYTRNSHIDNARVGDMVVNNTISIGRSDFVDHSGRTTELVDLILGLDGVDNVRAGSGNDFIYGGAGNDGIRGDAGDDVIYGEGNDDTLRGGAGNDELWGGLTNVEGSTDGETDTVTYADGSMPITLTYDGSVTAPISVQDGEGGLDALHSIEAVVGTLKRDTFRILGNIAAGTVLTFDAHGGQSPNPRDTVDTNGAASSTTVSINQDGTGYIENSATHGRINLLNFQTKIRGSNYDDIIRDLSSGDKEIMAGDGDDLVEVGVGPASITGGDGHDELYGGDGNDVLAGGLGNNILHGGAGSDRIISTSDGYRYNDPPGGDVIDGGEGHDWISLQGNNLSVRGGGGNDVIDTRFGGSEEIYFGAQDGHDTIISSGGYSVHVIMEGISLLDVTFIFEQVGESFRTGSDGDEGHNVEIISGNLAVLVNATGSTIVIPDQGLALHRDYITDAPITYVSSWQGPLLRFVDGTIEDWQSANNQGLLDYGSPRLVFSDISSYETAAEDFREATAADGNTEGGTGDDTLSGTSGDDTYTAGDGDDSIEASAGSDTIDGGAGEDELVLLGGEADYLFAHNPDGSTNVASADGWIAGTRFMNVEKVSFIGDGISVATGSLFTGIGTAGDDVLKGSNGDDQITGLAGNDSMAGGRGDDLLDGGEGTDTVTFTGMAGEYAYYRSSDGSIEIEALVGKEGYDTLIDVEQLVFEGDNASIAVADIPERGTGDDDVIIGTAMVDYLFGGDGNDVMTGLGGADSLNGFFGADTMIGGAGDDSYTVDNTADSIIEELDSGDDTVFSNADFTLSANIEKLYLSGTASIGYGNEIRNSIFGYSETATTLVGFGGDDDLFAGSYDDAVEGGSGNDFISGGFGNDTAIFSGELASYSLLTSDGMLSVVDTEAGIDGDDGTDTLINVETLQFKDDQAVSLAAPIVLDLDGDGVELLSSGDTRARFDLSGDGIADRTSWIGSDDAFLFLDRDRNGTMSGISELSFAQDKSDARSDLDGLSTFDSNSDGMLSSQDAEFASFMMWRDEDGDGRARSSEILSLQTLGIEAIRLEGTAVSASWEWGSAAVINRGEFVRLDGSTGSFADVALTYHRSEESEPTLAARRLIDAAARFGSETKIAALAEWHQAQHEVIGMGVARTHWRTMLA